MLDPSSPIPLYYQLKAQIETNIRSGQWKPGDRVPSEIELGETYQVSRTTVRQALGDLVNQGMLNRIQGKGTFVAQPRIQARLVHLTGFTQEMRSLGKRPGQQILEFSVRPATPYIAQALHMEPQQPIIVLKRLRLADEVPMAVETAHLSQGICQGLIDLDLQGRSLYQTLSHELGVIPTRARQQLEAIACPRHEARLLGIRKGSPVLHIHRTTYDQHGRPFEQVESYYRGDRYVFQAELTHEAISSNTG